MRRGTWIVLGLAVAMSLLGAPAGAAQVSVEELLEDPESFTGEITVIGELVGDYGFRGDGWMWTQLNDDSYARRPVLEDGELSGANVGIGVRMAHEIGESLDPPGGYRRRGPLVEITGPWRYLDPERGGETYLEVRTLRVLEPGRPLSEEVSWLPFGLAAALLAAAGALWATRRRREV